MQSSWFESTLFYGAVINPRTLRSYDAHPRCLVAVGTRWQHQLAGRGLTAVATEHLVELKDWRSSCSLVSSIPIHFTCLRQHAPQVPNIGTGQQYELLDWLANVTFPTEAKFADVAFAKRVYQQVVRGFIDAGTTTCCYYATLHLDASKVLADTVHAQGQRGFIGKCNMNHDCPSYYSEPSPEESISATHSIISYIRSLPSASSIHAAAGTPQPLNTSEVKYTNELFPDAGSYAGVYDSFGLLREGTILAHAVHLTPPEVDLIKERNAGISHCPTSNFNLRSGVAPVGKFLDKGIKVGLGTDVSGGFSVSILSEIQHASMASKVLQFTNAAAIDTTLEGRGRKKHIGSFAPGKSFDALVVSPSGKQIGMWGSGEKIRSTEESESPTEKRDLDEWLERFLFCGDDRNVDRVYVQGRWIGGRSFTGF
ncbi:guanine deaminase [Ephemerocybe angulata]|uniref:Guanine deaminase n=1 Tax=Ephemerocybe angulata TaxID=980116 RepID=A0A8H6MC42_9AGAR|nr:guanine deaminase [Tulosesus angulatus]